MENNSLQMVDVVRLQAAQDSLRLGNLNAALEQLNQMSGAGRSHPEALRIQWRICAARADWEGAREAALSLTRLDPNSRFGWLHLAYALRKLNRTAEACEVLQRVVSRFARNATLPFYLACYRTHLGDQREGAKWLGVAFEIADQTGQREALRAKALDEPDLSPLWQCIPD